MSAKSVTTMVRSYNPPKTNNPPPGKVTRTTTVVQSGKRSRRRRRNRRLNQGGPSATSTWLNSLNDPFNYGGVRLGWGCMVPTTLVTAYLRFNFTANADGSFSMIMVPQVTGMFDYNNAAHNIASWSTMSATNASVLNTALSEARIVSGGLRCIINQPATATPGILYVGSIRNTNVSNISSYTNDFLVSLSTSKMGIGRKGATGFLRHEDTDSFNFNYGAVAGFSGTQLFPFSIPYICGTGFGSSQPSVFVEVILNLEAIVSEQSSGIAVAEDLGLGIKTPADEFASGDAAVRAIRPALLDNVHEGDLHDESLGGAQKGWIGNIASSILSGAENSAAVLSRHSNLLSLFGRIARRGLGSGSSLSQTDQLL